MEILFCDWLVPIYAAMWQWRSLSRYIRYPLSFYVDKIFNEIKSLQVYGFTHSQIPKDKIRLEFSKSELISACESLLGLPDGVCAWKYEEISIRDKIFPDYIEANCERRAVLIERLLDDEFPPLMIVSEIHKFIRLGSFINTKIKTSITSVV